jgi:hypothetical protein
MWSAGPPLIPRTEAQVVTRTKTELMIALTAVVLGTVAFLFHCTPAEVLSLLLACVALGMLLFRTLPPDDSSSRPRERS